MSGQLRSGIKKYFRFILIFFISFSATGLLYATGILKYLDKVIYDICVNNRVLKSSLTKTPLIAAIDLTDASIEDLGDSLDTRKAFSDIIDILAEVNASPALDFIFRNEKKDDASLLKSVSHAKNSVIAALAVDKKIVNAAYSPLNEQEQLLLQRHIWRINVMDKGSIPQAASFILPFPALLETAAQIAHINIEPDSDGVYRRTPLLYEWEDGYIPSLALAAAVLHYGISVETITLKAGSYLALPLSETEIIKIPVDTQGGMLIPYTDAWANDTKRISFSTVAQAAYDDSVFEKVHTGLSGRIALLSEISTSQKDYGPSSFEKLYPLSGIHAEVLSGILDGLEKRSFIGWASIQYKLLMLLVIICAVIFNFLRNREIFFHLGFLVIFVLICAVSILLWHMEAISPWLSFPLFLLFFFWLFEFLYRLFIRYREQLLLNNALSRYFPIALAQRIMREGKTELTPAFRELTILFSDISGFTKWSSDKLPKNVHDFLSDYLESMAEILFSYGGTVDKFMGDGILAFFGDPFDMPNQAEQCIKAAVAMQEKIRILAAKWKPLVDIDLKVRIGINTGKVIVGNLGHKTRIEYTVIGAAVNLAQRMESNAPVGGILVTSDVHEKVKDLFTFSEKQNINVKGYQETIDAYIIIPNS